MVFFENFPASHASQVPLDKLIISHIFFSGYREADEPRVLRVCGPLQGLTPIPTYSLYSTTGLMGKNRLGKGDLKGAFVLIPVLPCEDALPIVLHADNRSSPPSWPRHTSALR